MEAFGTLTGYTSIISFLIQFYTLSDNSEPELEDFYNWLYKSNHKNTAEIIKSNKELQTEIQLLIQGNHNQISLELSKLNESVSNLSNKIDTHSELSSKDVSEYGLSKQAINVLKQFANSNSKSLHRFETLKGIDLVLDGCDNIKYSDERFIDTDIQSLVDNNLIIKKKVSKNCICYYITRNAINFIELIDS